MSTDARCDIRIVGAEEAGLFFVRRMEINGSEVLVPADSTVSVVFDQNSVARVEVTLFPSSLVVEDSGRTA